MTEFRRAPFDRRLFLAATGGLAAGLAVPGLWPAFGASSAMLGFANGERPLVRYPEKRELLRLTERPPQLETPFSVFNDGVITPNDAFFVRYHLANIPLNVDEAAFRLKVTGAVKNPQNLSVADLKAKFPGLEITAVNQCSGNGRGFSTPRVGGGQLGNGAMGNAVWSGVSLKSVLDAAGVSPKAVDVTFRGLDEPVFPATPAYVKSLPVGHARDGEVMLAYAMNGKPLPMLNGFPLRLVVPGYFGTYWVKHLSHIEVLESAFEGFWMKTAYRIPDNACACVPAGTKPEKTVPINKMRVRSFITSLENGSTIKAKAANPVRGIAFDGGSGIKEVKLSIDDGKTWQATKLGKDLGKYSFREWSTSITLPTKGTHRLLVQAVGGSGETQPKELLWNPAGYLRNLIEATEVRAV